MILLVLWLPTRQQLIVGPLALLAPLALTLWRGTTMNTLGLDWRGFVRSLWILPAAVGLAMAGVAAARSLGSYHPLYQAKFGHFGGYLFWTLYQQFLLQGYFMPRLSRVLTRGAEVAITSLLFAIAHLPNLWLALATLIWGAISCLLFRRYRNLWALGLAQGLLGLCFAACVPDALHHHLRVGLGYLRYHEAASRR